MAEGPSDVQVRPKFCFLSYRSVLGQGITGNNLLHEQRTMTSTEEAEQDCKFHEEVQHDVRSL